jgi:hypothetical protein
MSGRQYTKKYTERPSPPYPANLNCGATKTGNDGYEWTSVPDKNGVCRWVPGFRQVAGARSGAKLKAIARRSASPAKKPAARKSVSKPKKAPAKRAGSKAKKTAAKRARSSSPCPRGKNVVVRKAYTRADGTRVKGTTYCRKK